MQAVGHLASSQDAEITRVGPIVLGLAIPSRPWRNTLAAGCPAKLDPDRPGVDILARVLESIDEHVEQGRVAILHELLVVRRLELDEANRPVLVSRKNTV